MYLQLKGTSDMQWSEVGRGAISEAQKSSFL